MARHGRNSGLLDSLHVDGCIREEYASCIPVVTGVDHQDIEVVYVAWCDSCGAADWVVV